jgi:type VI secretion system protein ImpA
LRIKEIRQWFEAMEPSSPVGALLNLSEKTVGRSYVELQQIMPQELIAKLNDGQE